MLRRSNMKDVDFIDLDNSDPPQLWAWAGEYGDESSEALFRLPSEGILQRFLCLEKECARLDEECSDYSRLAMKWGDWLGRLEEVALAANVWLFTPTSTQEDRIKVAYELNRVLCELVKAREEENEECSDDCSAD